VCFPSLGKIESNFTIVCGNFPTVLLNDRWSRRMTPLRAGVDAWQPLARIDRTMKKEDAMPILVSIVAQSQTRDCMK
jgi:hypothetical protein